MSDEDKGLNKYIVKVKKYITKVNTVTMKRFGPSGSSIKKNITREHSRDVINKIRKDIFFEERCMIEVYRME